MSTTNTTPGRGRLGIVRWTDLLFVIGSACFALASLPGYGSWLGQTTVGVTYFVGSLFFTSAGYLQFVSSCNPDRADPARGGHRLRLVAFRPRDPNWLASAVQSAGTLWFNINTFNALTTGLTVQDQNAHVWRPDFLGSICFLVASGLAIHVVNRESKASSRHRRSGAWREAWANMAGSIFFMASAIAAFVMPTTGTLLDASLANSGTLLGALCFLWAAAHDYRDRRLH